MNDSLRDKKVAILATDGFEYVELMEPRKALDDAGAQTEIVSPKDGKIQGWNHDKPGAFVSVNVPLKQAHPDNYDALLLPGGVMNPDQLRTNPDAVHFVRAFFDAKKPVAAICHGPWMLVEADVLEGRTVTSWPSLKTDIGNAGGVWKDQEVIADKGLITSRKPQDIPAFNRTMLAEFAASKS